MSIQLIDVDVIAMLWTVPGVRIGINGFGRFGRMVLRAASTMVTDGTQVKILAWYDNEWGYANRMAELARIVAVSLGHGRAGP